MSSGMRKADKKKTWCWNVEVWEFAKRKRFTKNKWNTEKMENSTQR